MNRYRLLGNVVLGFIVDNEQQDVILGPSDNVTLDSDGHTIWAFTPTQRAESTTQANAIDAWLRDGLIEEIPIPSAV